MTLNKSLVSADSSHESICAKIIKPIQNLAVRPTDSADSESQELSGSSGGQGSFNRLFSNPSKQKGRGY